jgi:hypothetical protein
MSTTVTELLAVCVELKKAAVRVAELRTRRDRGIIDLLNDGHSTEDIAATVRLSQPRIVQLRQEALMRETAKMQLIAPPEVAAIEPEELNVNRRA